MARVRLNAGALTAVQVRMSTRGASERLRSPGDDINSTDGRDGRDGRDGKIVCGGCGSSKKVDATRPRCCAPCLADEQIVRGTNTRLRAAGQPALGSASNKTTANARIRKEGEAGRQRLAGRRRATPRCRPSSPPTVAPTSTSPRRVSAGQKAAGERRLQMCVEKLDKELKTMARSDRRRDQLREDLHVARRLLADWPDGVH